MEYTKIEYLINNNSRAFGIVVVDNDVMEEGLSAAFGTDNKLTVRS